MNPSSHDFVTVEMRGLKAALVARAQAERVSVSVLVRRAVERELGTVGASCPSGAELCVAPASSIVKLSLRLTRIEAEQLTSGARLAGLSRGVFLAGMLAGVPVLSGDAGSRSAWLAGLNASNAELATLSRNIHRLTTLLGKGEVQPALAYRRMLETLDGDVRAHLRLAARALAELRPARPSARSAARTSPATASR